MKSNSTYYKYNDKTREIEEFHKEDLVIIGDRAFRRDGQKFGFSQDYVHTDELLSDKQKTVLYAINHAERMVKHHLRYMKSYEITLERLKELKNLLAIHEKLRDNLTRN